MGMMYHVDKTALRKIYERYAIRRYKINSKTWMMVQIDGCKVREIVIDEMKDIIRRHFDSLPVTINNTPKHIIQNQLEDRLMCEMPCMNMPFPTPPCAVSEMISSVMITAFGLDLSLYPCSRKPIVLQIESKFLIFSSVI